MKFSLMSSKRYHFTWLWLFAIKLIDRTMLQALLFSDMNEVISLPSKCSSIYSFYYFRYLLFYDEFLPFWWNRHSRIWISAVPNLQKACCTKKFNSNWVFETKKVSNACLHLSFYWLMQWYPPRVLILKFTGKNAAVHCATNAISVFEIICLLGR
jgi:hypothetical protein